MAGESKEALLRSLRGQVDDERVLDAIAAVPRDAFVPSDQRERAWADAALPIGNGQTISQPLVVAHMCALLDVRPGDRVLDVGTGSGYHAAVLAEMGGRVWSIERDPELSERAGTVLAALGYGVELVVGDGSVGYEPAAPYDAINVAAAAADHVPPALVRQLAPGGRLVVPVGERLVFVSRDREGRLRTPQVHGAVRFVPLVSGSGWDVG
jgi:protein-L-isoaspartate(D-aspartate) O-methyltransferase